MSNPSSIFDNSTDDDSSDCDHVNKPTNRFNAPMAKINTSSAFAKSLINQSNLPNHFASMEAKKKEEEKKLALIREKESQKIFDIMQLNAKQRQMEYEETKHKIREQRQEAYVIHGNALVFEGESYKQQRQDEQTLVTTHKKEIDHERDTLRKAHEALDEDCNQGISTQQQTNKRDCQPLSINPSSTMKKINNDEDPHSDTANTTNTTSHSFDLSTQRPLSRDIVPSDDLCDTQPASNTLGLTDTLPKKRTSRPSSSVNGNDDQCGDDYTSPNDDDNNVKTEYHPKRTRY